MSQRRKTFIDKLKPSTHGGGKVVACNRCGGDAEHVSTTIATCPRCDKPREKAAGVSQPSQVELDDFFGDLWDEPTRPGLPKRAWYSCDRCRSQWFVDPDAVAGGQRCGCGGSLRVKT